MGKINPCDETEDTKTGKSDSLKFQGLFLSLNEQRFWVENDIS